MASYKVQMQSHSSCEFEVWTYYLRTGPRTGTKPIFPLNQDQNWTEILVLVLEVNQNEPKKSITVTDSENGAAIFFKGQILGHEVMRKNNSHSDSKCQ